MDKRIALGAFIIAFLVAFVVLQNGRATPNTDEKHALCSEGKLSIFLDIYYPGELRAAGYEIKDDKIVLRFHSITSGDLRINLANFTIPCIPRNLSPNIFEINVDGDTFYPSCQGVLTTPVSSETANSERSVYLLASPYNLSEIALIELPEGYSLKSLKLDNGTLIIEVSTGGNTSSVIVKSELLGKRSWRGIIYSDGSKTWTGRKSTLGDGECPILISPMS
ncbi:MAG: hypothetical protein PWQ79_984 [Thermococcaceae archaeon]|nr:hypothetical protein [Thermococcaceae archaeon]MDK2914069.1 hypothetical protein [Thermococcaceae archaeon]